MNLVWAVGTAPIRITVSLIRSRYKFSDQAGTYHSVEDHSSSRTGFCLPLIASTKSENCAVRRPVSACNLCDDRGGYRKYKPTDYFVGLGRSHTSRRTTDDSEQYVGVSHAIIHEYYVESSHRNDIALLRLQNEAQVNIAGAAIEIILSSEEDVAR